MKKSLLAVFTLVISLFLITGITSAAEEVVGSEVENVVGLDYPTYGWAQHNEEGELTGYKGINLGLGYSQKTYFEPGLKVEEFNNYWGWGTVGIVIPYGQIGTDYVFAPTDSGEFWTVGASLGLPFGTGISAAYHF